MGSIEQFYQAIQPMMKSANPDDIRQALAGLVAFYPEFAQGHNDLGVLSYQAGEKELARRHYEHAARLQPENITFQKNLADFYYVELGQVEDALRIYVSVLEMKPDDVETLLITGHICVAVHKFEDALTFYRRVLELDPDNDAAAENLSKIEAHLSKGRPTVDPDALYREAQLLADKKDPAGAMVKLRELLEAFPDHAIAHNDLGVMLYQSGDKESACSCYEQACRLQPENITFAKNLADYYFVEQGRVEDALRVYVDILAQAPEDVETLLMTGHICAGLEKFDDARVFYERVLEIEPWNNDAAECLEQLKQGREAGAHAGHESDADHYEHARKLAERGRGDEAVAELEALIRCRPEFALAHNDLGVLRLQAGQMEKALPHFERAAALEPENIVFQKNLADYYWVRLGRHEDALAKYVDILKLAPEDIETLTSLGNVCMALGKPDDARTFFERVLEIEPWNVEAGDKLEEVERMQRLAQTG